jgi:lipoteichoic acid synthase
MDKRRNQSTGGKFPVSLPEAGCIIFFIIAAIVKCSYFQFITHVSARPVREPVNLNMLAASFASIAIIPAVVYLLFNRKRILALFIVDLLLSVLLLADTVFYRYYHNAITIPILLQIGLVSSLGDSIKDLLRWTDLALFVDLPLFAGGLFLFFKSGIRRFPILPRLTTSVIVIIACVFGISYATHNAGIIIKQDAAKLFTTDKNKIIRYLGVFTFHFHDVKTFATENFTANKYLSAKDKEAIEQFYNDRLPAGSSFEGIAKGKNLIVIQLEALQEFLINLKVDGREVTPFLNSFLKDSLYFDNFYYQVGNGNTSDAEFLLNTSLYPLKDGSVYFRYPLNLYHTLPQQLKEKGYATEVYHAYSPSFWNRTVMYGNIGFDRFYSNKDFKTDEILGWALSDASFFRQTLDKLNPGKPFYSFMITLSSHYPNNAFSNVNNFDVGEYKKTNVGNYIRAAHYVDSNLKVFIEGLKKKGLYDNSLIVIYGDHLGLLKKDAPELMKFLGRENNEYEWMKLQKVPLLLHYPGLKNGEAVHAAAGEIDLFPTIANLMDLDASYALGKDMLNTTKGYAALRFGSVATDNYIYASETQKAYDLKTGKVLSPELYLEEVKKYQRENDISELIIQKDAFRKIEIGDK